MVWFWGVPATLLRRLPSGFPLYLLRRRAKDAAIIPHAGEVLRNKTRKLRSTPRFPHKSRITCGDPRKGKPCTKTKDQNNQASLLFWSYLFLWGEQDSNLRRSPSRFTVCPRWPLEYLPGRSTAA